VVRPQNSENLAWPGQSGKLHASAKKLGHQPAVYLSQFRPEECVSSIMIRRVRSSAEIKMTSERTPTNPNSFVFFARPQHECERRARRWLRPSSGDPKVRTRWHCCRGSAHRRTLPQGVRHRQTGLWWRPYVDPKRLIVGKPATVGGVPHGPLPRSRRIRATTGPVRQPRPVSVIEWRPTSATWSRKGVAGVLSVSEPIGSAQQKK
jgi:hypothetical protein